MQYDDSETRFEEGQVVSKRMPLGNTCRWPLILSVLLSLTGLAACSEYPFSPGVKTVNEEPYNNLNAAKAGGLGGPRIYRGSPNSPEEREVALSAHGNVRVQRSASKTHNVTCESKKQRKDHYSIYVQTTMWRVRHEIYPKSANLDPHLRLLFTYTPFRSVVEEKSLRPEGFQIVVLLTMLASSLAVVFEIHNCHLPQNVWLVKNPIIDGAQVDLTKGQRLSEFYCDDTFIRDGNVRKVRVTLDVDLNVNLEWLTLKACFGNSRKCSIVYDGKVHLERHFDPGDVETVIMVETPSQNLMKQDIANVKTWCELRPQ